MIWIQDIDASKLPKGTRTTMRERAGSYKEDKEHNLKFEIQLSTKRKELVKMLEKVKLEL